MKLGISTACFYPMPLEDTITHIGELGFGTVEVFFNTESEFSDTFCDLLRARAHTFGIEIGSVHPYTSLMEGVLLFSNYPRRTEDGLRQYRHYFAQAARLGARYLVLHGERDMGNRETPEVWARKCETYHRLCALAEQYGVQVAQENVAWCRPGASDYVRKLYREVPALRYTLDLKQANRAGQDWRALCAAMGDRLVNVHLNDFSDTHDCLLPGQGQMDYAVLLRMLHEQGYQGNLMLEVYRSNFDGIDELRQTAVAFADRYRTQGVVFP